jgi:hypothetical protein
MSMSISPHQRKIQTKATTQEGPHSPRPVRNFARGSRGAFVLVGAEDVEREAAQSGEVLGSVVLAGGVLVHDDVENPVQTVLDVPMGADDVEKRAAERGVDRR